MKELRRITAKHPWCVYVPALAPTSGIKSDLEDRNRSPMSCHKPSDSHSVAENQAFEAIVPRHQETRDQIRRGGRRGRTDDPGSGRSSERNPNVTPSEATRARENQRTKRREGEEFESDGQRSIFFVLYMDFFVVIV
ncbi:hypothetical protein GW17_00030921 [Ensete ventricosum]|nr:hypothetical protein GW17_00030921 [Ensete ventricosum]